MSIRNTPNLRGVDFGGESASSVGTFILYEDLPAGKRAKETCDALAWKLGEGWQIEVELSSFRSLRHPGLRRRASASASDASLLVISCRGHGLPLPVWKWAELSLRRAARPAALLALVAENQTRTEPSRVGIASLAELARRRGLEFFSNCQATEAFSTDRRPMLTL